jgi:hypothetical protein
MNDEMQPLLACDLQGLKTLDRRRRDHRQVAAYVKAIYYTVLEEAKYGNLNYCTFWLVDDYQAKKYLLNTCEYNYPWHSKSIRKSDSTLKNYFMKRPIPEELYDRIFGSLKRLFPDCEITMEQDPINLLVIRW